MVPLPKIKAHHPTFLHFLCLQALYSLLLAFSFSIPGLLAQDITGLELAKTIVHDNYSVGALDTYFEDGFELIAYSNNSGSSTGDTLVIYDFDHDVVLAQVPGTSWSYDIRFIHADQLLFRNGSTLYRLTNFIAPTVTEVRQNVITFTISADKSTIAFLFDRGVIYEVEVALYNSSDGSLTMVDAFDIPGPLHGASSKLAFSPDGKYIALNGGYENNFVHIINTSTNVVSAVNTPDNEGTYSPSFYTHNGIQRLAVGGGYANGSVEIIDIEALEVEASVPVFPHYNYSVTFDKSQAYLVCGGYDGFINIYSVDGTALMDITSVMTGLVSQIVFTNDNDYLISGHSGNGMAKLYIHRILRTPLAIHEDKDRAIHLYPNPTNGWLMFGTMEKGLISIFDTRGNLILRKHDCGIPIDVSTWADGVYFLQMENEGSIAVQKFVKSTGR